MKRTIATALLGFTASCTDTVDTGFHLRGRLMDATSITDVIATTPSRVLQRRLAAPVSADGSFEITLEPGHAWLVTFADASKIGDAMLRGTLQLGSLDAQIPQAPGELDLGTVTLRDGRMYAPGVPWRNVASALGLDLVSAERLGAADDLVRRYANPDIDGNGVLDAREPDHDVRLDVLENMHLTVGDRDVTIDDLVRGEDPAQLGIHYLGTAVVVGAPPALMPVDPASSTFTFEQPFFGTAEGPNTPVIAAGAPVGQPHVLAGNIDGYPVAGVYARPGWDVPRGTYRYAGGDARLTFSDVDMPRDQEMSSAHELVVPVIQIVPTTPGCVADCTISAIRYSWMHPTSDGWLPAAPAETPQNATLDMIVWSPKARASQYIKFGVPTAPSGSISWRTRPDLLDGITLADMSDVTTGSLCSVTVSYTNLIGIRATSSVLNPATVCESH